MKTDLIPRKQNYEFANKTFGERNSFAKTDTDATFMRMKEDPMKNGQLKPGYNLQVASRNQYALYFDLFQRPTDTCTLIPFLSHIFNQTPNAARYIIADAGYDSEMNYQFISDDLERDFLIPYGMYEKEQTRAYHKDKRKVANWEYFENKAKEQLSSEIGHQVYGQRKIDVEPIFANLKAHLRFRRFSVRGLSATWNEVGIALMANNLVKLAKVLTNLKRYGQKQEGNSHKSRISFLFFIEFELCPERVFLVCYSMYD